MRHTKPPSATVLMEGWMVHYTNKSTLVMKGERERERGRGRGRERGRGEEQKRDQITKNLFLFIYYFLEKETFLEA